MGLYLETVAGAAEFTGLAGAGQFRWDMVHMPRTTRVLVQTVAMHIDGGADPVQRIDIFFVDPDTGTRILLARGLAAQVVGPDPTTDGADLTICGRVVPRNADGTCWRLEVITQGKTETGTAVVDFTIQPWPDTTDRDAPPP